MAGRTKQKVYETKSMTGTPGLTKGALLRFLEEISAAPDGTTVRFKPHRGYLTEMHPARVSATWEVK